MSLPFGTIGKLRNGGLGREHCVKIRKRKIYGVKMRRRRRRKGRSSCDDYGVFLVVFFWSCFVGPWCLGKVSGIKSQGEKISQLIAP